MATTEKQRKFARLAEGGFRLPIPVLPKVPDLKTPAGREQFDTDLEEWRKKLQLGQDGGFGAGGGGGLSAGGGGVAVVPVPTTPGTQVVVGVKGDKGDKGDFNFTVVPFHVWIAKRTDGIAGQGIIIDPYDGSTHEKLDKLMRSFGPNTVIHFGPGVFETRGYPSLPQDLAYKWRPKNGWKVYGSGLDVTTIKLVGADLENAQWGVFFVDIYLYGLVDDFELHDLTIDCNLNGQPANVKVGAIQTGGNRNIIRRVRIKNWGTRKTESDEPFALVVGLTSPGHGDIYGCLLDGVIIDRPQQIASPSTIGSMMSMGGSPTDWIWSTVTVTRVGATASATGAYRHALRVGAWFRMRGATQSEYNGSFQVSEVVDAFTLKFTVIGSPATPATGAPEMEHGYDPNGLGMGILRNAIIRNCVLDGQDFTGTLVNGITAMGDGVILESNTIRNVSAAIYMDTFRGLSITIRDNILQRVVLGIDITLGSEAYGFDTVVIERNLIELLALPVVPAEEYIPMVNTQTNAGAIGIVGVRLEKPLTYRAVSIRNNILRFVDQVDSSFYTAIALVLRSISSLVVTGNLIGFREPRQIRVFDPVTSIVAWGNRNPDGNIVLTRRVSTDRDYPDPDVELIKAQKLAVWA